MKEWVQPFLRMRGDPNISEAELEREIAVPILCFRRLSNLFNINFQSNVRLTELLGSVLADLPEDVFYEFLVIRNLFFLLPKPLIYIQALQTVEGRPGILCVFSDRLMELGDTLVRAAIAHELAHIVFGHYTAESHKLNNKGALEDAADERAISWGFDFEIRAIREFLKSMSQI